MKRKKTLFLVKKGTIAFKKLYDKYSPYSIFYKGSQGFYIYWCRLGEGNYIFSKLDTGTQYNLSDFQYDINPEWVRITGKFKISNMNEYNNWLNSLFGSGTFSMAQGQPYFNEPAITQKYSIDMKGIAQEFMNQTIEPEFSSKSLRKLSDELVEKLLDKDCLDCIMKNTRYFLECEEKIKFKNEFESYKADFFTKNAERKFEIPLQQVEYDEWMQERRAMSNLKFEDWFSKNKEFKVNSPEENLKKIKEHFIAMGLEQKRKILDI